jgi:DNA-binding MarR family transcriptional regulator
VRVRSSFCSRRIRLSTCEYVRIRTIFAMPGSVKRSALSTFYSRPAFLLRRANQIAFSIASREGAAIGLTPPQYAFLIVIGKCPGLDQRGLGKALGFDRVTAGQVLHALDARGLINRSACGIDSRRKIVVLTKAGQELVKKSHSVSLRVTQRVLAALAPKERQVFMKLLFKLVTTLNSESPTPVMPPEAQDRGRPRPDQSV